LDKEFSDKDAEIERLKADNLRLQAQVNPLQREVQQLKDQLVRATDDSNKLCEEEVQILRMIAEVGPKAHVNAAAVAGLLNLNDTKVTYFLKRLEENNYIHGSYASLGSTEYKLKHRGNEYLVRNHLV
jgi:chromosome segregation ATPase